MDGSPPKKTTGGVSDGRLPEEFQCRRFSAGTRLPQAAEARSDQIDPMPGGSFGSVFSLGPPAIGALFTSKVPMEAIMPRLG